MNKLIIATAIFCGIVLAQDKYELVETRVSLPGQYSSFSIYNETPESPDGKRLTYVVYDEYPDPNKLVSRGQLWICDRNIENHKMIRPIEDVICNHNGAMQQWIDNDSIAYSGTHISKIGKTYLERSIRVVNADTGELEHGPYTGGWAGANYEGKLLMMIQDNKNSLGARGLYELDTATGETRLIFTPEDFGSYKYQWRGSDDPAGWFFAHGQYSKDGSHISFTVRTRGIEGRQYLFTCKADGSDLRCWGEDKPMHFHWYDEDTIWGSDSGVNDGLEDNKNCRRWDRDKKPIELLAGLACHTSVSFDREWVAGETWYNISPLKLFLYNKGNVDPAAVIFETDFTEIVWKGRGHVNPSFSRDGTRLYYNKPVSNNLKQAYYCDISEITSQKAK